MTRNFGSVSGERQLPPGHQGQRQPGLQSSVFRIYDKRIRKDITFFINNLGNKYGPSEQGAKEVCIYVSDNDPTKSSTRTDNPLRYSAAQLHHTPHDCPA